MFRRTIRRVPRDALHTQDTTGVDDTALSHMSKLRPHTMHDACYVDTEYEIPLIIVLIFQFSNTVMFAYHSRHICCAIQSAELLNGGLHPDGDLTIVPHIHDRGHQIISDATELGRSVFQRLLVDIYDGQSRSLRLKLFPYL